MTSVERVRRTAVPGTPRPTRLAALAVVLWGLLAVDASAQGSVESDRAALVTLYDATGGSSWVDSTNWKTAAPLGEWHGVTTDAAGRVTSLALHDNALAGPVPPALGSLSRLRVLDLSRNVLTGAIPAALGSLVNVVELYLFENELTGPVPAELGSLANVEVLAVDRSPMTGPLPLELTELSRLKWFYAQSTGLCAPADAVFQEWLATIYFDGETCGSPPEPVGTVPAQTLNAGGAALGVSMAAYFRDLNGDPLTYEAASSRAGTVTALVGDDTVWLVPGTAGRATVTVTARDPDDQSATQTIDVTVVASAGPQSDREVLAALYDATGGAGWTDSTNWKTPVSLGEWHGVTTDADGRVTGLSLHNNALAGPVPPALGSLSNLSWLRLGGNALTGPIPSALGSLSNLAVLNIASNYLTGPIPVALGSLPSLEFLQLSFNDLSGPIPDELGRLSNLSWLDLGFNDLSGPIPDELGRLSNLSWLGLISNALTGPIPDQLGSLSNLEFLQLGFNDLSGPIPDELGRLSNLGVLELGFNDLSGPIPDELGRLSNLGRLDLRANALTGPIPGALADLTNLEWLDLSYTWGLTGPLPRGLQLSRLRELDVFVTQSCAPATWRDWVATIEFRGRLCEVGADVTIDVAVVYTPAAREGAGSTAAMEAEIDLRIAETNEAYAASGVRHRLELVARSEVPYIESGDPRVDFNRLVSPRDGHMDEVHALREREGADLVHLIFDFAAALALLGGPFSLTCQATCSGITFAHELGHNMGLLHERDELVGKGEPVFSHPAYGYVNRRAFVAGAPRSSRWATIMAYGVRCPEAYFACFGASRFSSARHRFNGDPLGVPFGSGGSGLDGPADAVAVLDATGPAVALWGDRAVSAANRPPAAVGTLPDRTLALDSVLDVDVSQAFVDPDGDALVYTVSSASAQVVAVLASGARVTLTAAGVGTAAIRVTATDPDGLAATHSFTVTVAATVPFTDDPIVPGVTPVKAVHFTELRTRIDVLRRAAGLAAYAWTDPFLSGGMTPVRLAHLLELRAALAAAYAAAGRPAPRWTDAAPAGGTTPIRAVHLMELREAVVALE